MSLVSFPSPPPSLPAIAAGDGHALIPLRISEHRRLTQDGAIWPVARHAMRESGAIFLRMVEDLLAHGRSEAYDTPRDTLIALGWRAQTVDLHLREAEISVDARARFAASGGIDWDAAPTHERAGFLAEAVNARILWEAGPTDDIDATPPLDDDANDQRARLAIVGGLALFWAVVLASVWAFATGATARGAL